MPKCYSCTHYHGGFCELNGTHSFTGEICSSYEDECASVEKEMTREELRITKRALWLSRARTARANCCLFVSYRNAGSFKKWEWVERMCRAKAEEYR